MCLHTLCTENSSCSLGDLEVTSVWLSLFICENGDADANLSGSWILGAFMEKWLQSHVLLYLACERCFVYVGALRKEKPVMGLPSCLSSRRTVTVLAVTVNTCEVA